MLIAQLGELYSLCGAGVTCLLAHPPGPEAFETPWLGTQDIPRVTAAEPGGSWSCLGRGLQPPQAASLLPSTASATMGFLAEGAERAECGEHVPNPGRATYQVGTPSGPPSPTATHRRGVPRLSVIPLQMLCILSGRGPLGPTEEAAAARPDPLYSWAPVPSY